MSTGPRTTTVAVAYPQEPMLARPGTELPARAALAGRHAFEPKFDGYRAVVFINERGCAVQSRAGHGADVETRWHESVLDHLV